MDEKKRKLIEEKRIEMYRRVVKVILEPMEIKKKVERRRKRPQFMSEVVDAMIVGPGKKSS